MTIRTQMDKQIRILYIDDNPMDRALVRDSLEKEHGGFELSEAKSKQEFEKLIHQNVYDLVLTDFNILGFEGLQVLEMVKSVAPKTPVIIVTGTGSEEVAVKAMKQGAGDYVIKTPGHISRLPVTILSVLNANRTRLERKKAKKDLSKMNRIYRFISQINQLIVREKSRDQLFRDTCEIAVTYGKFNMAWIGLIDENNEIEPFTWAGYEENYLSQMRRIRLDHSPEADGLIGTAIRSGKYIFSNNVAEDPVLLPWKSEMLHRNYQSVIVLPIKLKGDVIGTLNLYSEEINFFDEKEITLLEEVISDISFALDSFDIEKRRKTAEEENRKLSRAVEQSPASVVITNQKGEIEYVNSKFCEITGYSRDEAIGNNPHILKSGVHNIEFYQSLWNTILSGNMWSGEMCNKKKNGELFWELASISPMVNENGEITHFIAVKEDITDRKKKDEELFHALEKAQESDRLKSAFLANMSHEIRTPMNGILGFAELLKEPDLTGEQQLDYIEIIEKSGARMLNIINDIVDISKIESGQMKVLLKKTNVNEQLDFIYKLFNKEVEQKGLHLSLKKSVLPSDLFIVTDREKLYAILANLVKNAIKYTQNGSIEFGCQALETLHATSLQFYVKDTGIGIAKDRQEDIFKRFIQADISDKMARQGAGLGLAISKAYVEMLGGKIWIESENGRGSTFYFTLPSHREPKEELISVPDILFPVEENPINKLIILIAEDDESSSQLISVRVQKFGKDVILVKTGTEAVEACRNNPNIDLILMDIKMPEMDGYDATIQIRQFNKEVIIVAQTAYALSGDREKAIEAGCNDYISKPIKGDDLKGLIEKYFSVQPQVN